MQPVDPPKPKDYPLTDKPSPEPKQASEREHDASKVPASKTVPTDATHGKQYTDAGQGHLDQSDPKATVVDEAYGRELRRRERIADEVETNIIHQVDGRTTAMAREITGDAAVLEQLRSQMQLDVRDNHAITTAQLETITATVARLRSYAAQLTALCASRDRPLPQVPTLPAPAHVPPARA